MRIALAEGADTVSYGATGKGNDQVRFELSYLALNPNLQIIAPWRIWDLNSRSRLVAYAEKHGIPMPTANTTILVVLLSVMTFVSNAPKVLIF